MTYKSLGAPFNPDILKMTRLKQQNRKSFKLIWKM